MDIHDPVPVFTTTDPFKADLIKNMLEDEGIRCALEGHDQSIGPGFIAIPIKVLVEAGQAEQAAKLIEEHESRLKDEEEE